MRLGSVRLTSSITLVKVLWRRTTFLRTEILGGAITTDNILLYYIIVMYHNNIRGTSCVTRSIAISGK